MIDERARVALRLTTPQALLLQAATLSGPGADEAFRVWIERVDVATLDRGSNRLLPLLWHTLVARGVEHPVMPLLKGVYRHTWFGNQVILGRLRAVQETLAGAGIAMLGLKGVALAYGVYQSPGLRPMDDLDILVRPADVPGALALLRDRGWLTPVRFPERLLTAVNGTGLHDADWNRLDLHSHLLPGGLRADLDVLRWERAITIDTGSATFRALDHTDQLLHAVVHGALSESPGIRWIADALAILRRPQTPIDWERLLADAEAEGRGPVVASALPALVALFAAPVPASVLERLAARGISLGERLGHRVETGPPIFFAGRLARRWIDYRRWRRHGGPERQISFVAYVQRVWGVKGREMPGQLVRHAAQRLRLDLQR